MGLLGMLFNIISTKPPACVSEAHVIGMSEGCHLDIF